jgi:hypothetical protein
MTESNRSRCASAATPPAPTKRELYGDTPEYTTTLDERGNNVPVLSPNDIHNEPAGEA